MSDDLIKRLRQHRYNTWNDDLGPEPDKALAADRIEQLENERVNLMTALDKTMSVLDTQTQFLFQARTNLESVQAKLTKAVEALRVSIEGLNWAKAYLSTGGIDSMEVDHADATVYAALAELEKENE